MVDTRRECEYGFYVLKKIAKLLNLGKSNELMINCPSPECLGMVKVVIKMEDGRPCVTAQCTDSSKDCDFPTMSGPIEWDCIEGEDTE